jgi:high-affinity Fe2+/Pb2+ permease
LPNTHQYEVTGASFLISLREGLEISLVLAILIADGLNGHVEQAVEGVLAILVASVLTFGQSLDV